MDRHNLDQRGWVELRIVEQRQLNRFAESGYVHAREQQLGVGIGAPKRTLVGLIERLNKEVNISIEDPKFKARLANLGGTPLPGSPAEFGKLIADETKKWGKVIVAANIKPM